jgi:hypothetical protein
MGLLYLLRRPVEFSVLDGAPIDNKPRYMCGIVLLGQLMNSTLCLSVITDGRHSYTNMQFERASMCVIFRGGNCTCRFLTLMLHFLAAKLQNTA